MVTDVVVETFESPDDPAANVFSLRSIIIGLSRSLTATFERLIKIRRFNFEKLSLWSDVLISSGKRYNYGEINNKSTDCSSHFAHGLLVRRSGQILVPRNFASRRSDSRLCRR